MSAKIIFLKQDDQQAKKQIFLLNISHPSINQNSLAELRKSAARALTTITEALKIEEYQIVADSDKEHFNKYLASAPTYEDVMKAGEYVEPEEPEDKEVVKKELGARRKETGATGGMKPVVNLPFYPGNNGSWKEDQNL